MIGLEEDQYAAIRSRAFVKLIGHELIPHMAVKDGQLLVESKKGPWLVPVDKVVFHGIFEDDHDIIAGLALWGGPCLPNARAMMDCRLRLPCLVRALQFTRFGAPLRSFAAAGVTFDWGENRVAKWGNWHCGENKERIAGEWRSEDSSIIEPFLEGTAVRIVLIGERYWQIRLEGETWLKSIHAPNAAFMEVNPDLLEDSRRIAQGFGLEILGNDYIVAPDGTCHLLEVNHIPNVTRFPEIWEAYLDYTVNWIERIAPSSTD